MAGVGLLEILRGGFKDFDEFVADDFALLLGVGDAFEFCEKLLRGIHRFHADAELAGEEFFHGGALVGAQEAVVHKDAGQAVADGFVQECRCDGGVHAAAQAEDDASIADLLLDFAAGAIDEGFHRPIGFAAADAVHKVGQNLAAAWCVDHFGMELQAVDVALGVADDRVWRVFGFSKRTEAGGEFGDFVAVAVPDIQCCRKFVEEGAFRVAFEFSRAVFAFGRALDLAAESVGDELHAVADAEHGDAEIVDFAVHLRRLGRVNARWTAREDDSRGLQLGDGGRFGVVRNDLRVDLTFPNAAGDDLCVLGTEIQNEDFISGGLLRHGVLLSEFGAEVVGEGVVWHDFSTALDSLLELLSDILRGLFGNRATAQEE